MAFTTWWDTVPHIIHPSIIHFLCNCFRVKNEKEQISAAVWFFRFSSFCVIKRSNFCITFCSGCNLIESLPPAQLLYSKTPPFFYTSSFLTFQLSLHQSLKSINISCVFYGLSNAAVLVLMLKDFFFFLAE